MRKLSISSAGWICVIAAVILSACGNGGSGIPNPDGDNSLQGMVDRHNATRSANGAPELATNAALMQIAQDQADYIASIGDAVHTDATGHHVDYRATNAGYAWIHIGENVGFAIDAETLYDLWLNSPPHLGNITDDTYTEIGVGMAQHGSYQYWCVVFGAR